MDITEFITNGKLPASRKERSALCDKLRDYIISTNKQIMQTNQNNPVTILGMSINRVFEVADAAPKGGLLKALTDAYSNDASPARPAPAPKPAPKAPASIPLANRYAELSDSLLVKFSLHRSTAAVDRAEMQREIAARRITVQPSGSYSRSFNTNK
jgi:hypothetical protein